MIKAVRHQLLKLIPRHVEETTITDAAAIIVQNALPRLNKIEPFVIGIGERRHTNFNDQALEIKVFRRLKEKGASVVLCAEMPRNILQSSLVHDYGIEEKKAGPIAATIAARDSNGHNTAKALIGGKTFLSVSGKVKLQGAIQNGIPIIFADAAYQVSRPWLLDLTDYFTASCARQAGVTAPAQNDLKIDGESPLGMAVRNLVISQSVSACASTVVLSVGTSHIGGAASNIQTDFYFNSLKALFKRACRPFMPVCLDPRIAKALPPDFPVFDRSIQFFDIGENKQDLDKTLREAKLDPALYNPRNYENTYQKQTRATIEAALS